MPDKREAIAKYLPKKLSGEMSLAEIKVALSEEGYDQGEISEISREISDRELETVRSSKSVASYLNHRGFSYLMIVISLGIIAYSSYQMWNFIQLSETYIVPLYFYLLPSIFVVAAVFFLIKHLRKLLRA